MVIQEKQSKTFLQEISHSNYILRDHRVHGTRILPGVALLDMVYRLSLNYLGTQNIELKHILFKQPVVTSESFDKNIFITFTPDKSHYKITITSQKIKGNVILDINHDDNMECLLFIREHADINNKLDVNAFINRAKLQWDMDDIYGLTRKADIHHFVFMKTLGTVYQRDDEIIMKLHLSELAEKFRDKFYAHPAFMDASTLAELTFNLSATEQALPHDMKPYIPFTIERFCIYKPLPQTIYTYTQKKGVTNGNIIEPQDIVTGNIAVFNEQGEVLVEFDKITFKQIRNPFLIKKLIEHNLSIANQPQQPVVKESMEQQVFIVSKDKSSTQQAIISYLQKNIGMLLKKNPDEIDIKSGFYDLGLDSTQLLGLVKDLEKKIKEQLYPTLLFEYSNIQRLTEYLLENHEKGFLSSDEQGEKVTQTDCDIHHTANCKTLFFEPVWIKQDIIRNQSSTHKGRHMVILYKELPALQSFIQHQTDAGLVVSLTSEEVHTPYQLEDKFIQLFEIIQKQLQQKNLYDIMVQVVTDSENEGKYAYVLGGLLKTAYLENPKIHSQIIMIDRLSSQPAETIIKLLQDEAVSHKTGVAEIHYRGESLQRYVKHLKEKNLLPEQHFSYKENGVYVITGGAGGLGLLIADHLASKTGVKLALIGRSQLDSLKEEKIRRLIEKGAEVIYLEADISKTEEAVKAFNIIKDKFRFITGVFHSAGTLKDQFIIKKNPAEIQEVFNPKVQGIWNLDEMTKDEKLEFFIAFSSGSAIMGNLGQADYASANAFMDIFAMTRQQKVNQGKAYGKTISVNWPLWSNGGMQIGSELEQIMYGTSGTKPLPTTHGLQAMDMILGQNSPQTVVFFGEETKIRSFVKTYKTSEEDNIETNKENSVYNNVVIKPEIKMEMKPEQSIYHSGDIAIIGVSGRYPMANTLEQFYQNLREGKDCITSIPKDRWKNYEFSYDVEQFYKYGGFLDEIDKFDPRFFNIYPRQAETMDPQARLFLETAWEACEDAGFYRDRAEHCYVSSSDKSVGVFAGVFWSHYELFGAESTQRGKPMSFGVSPSSIPNMVSYCLNFHGPSMAVDTMCSSSLTAIHLACESIRRHECDYAIAGGVNLVTHPHKYIFLTQVQFLSLDGRCRSFGEGGDGYVPGEGVGAVLLTSLERAEKEGYSIYGIIKGSAINHVGKTSGVTVPDPVAQSEVISDTLKKSGIDPRTISYIEAHGTGTSLGDPIEIQGLKRAFNRWTYDKQYCVIGSIKSNIGHLEAAAGIAGLTKLLLQFKYKEIFPLLLHSEKLNPYIPFNDTPFYIEQQLRKWEQPIIETDGKKSVYPRRAGLSSFGANGSNAHIIIEEYISRKPSQRAVAINTMSPVVVPLSAKNAERLRVYAQKLLDFLRNSQDSLKSPTNDELEKFVQNDVARIVSDLIGVDVKDLDHNQDFSELNVDYFQLAKLQQSLRDKWGADIGQNEIVQSQSIENLALQLVKDNRTELEKQYFTGRSLSQTETHRGISLVDLAYTFQVGREPMENRMVFVVDHINELIQKLELYISGKDNIHNCYQGIVKKGKKLITFHSDEDLKSTIKKWISKSEITKVAELWIKGANIDWNNLYDVAKPRRIGLPTYPFSREQYWVPGIKTKSAKSGNVADNIADNVRDASIPSSFSQTALQPGMFAALNFSERLEKPGEISLSALSKVQVIPTTQEIQNSTPIILSPINSPLLYQGTNDASELVPQVHETFPVETLRQELRKSLAEVLNMNQSEVDVDSKFVDMGLDSITGVEWIQVINRRYDTSITATKVYDYPSICEFAEFLARELSKQNRSTLKDSLPTADQPDLMELSVSFESLREKLTITLAEALNMDQSEIDVDDKFIDMGLDSITGVEWIQLINKQYGTSIAATKVYDYPSVREFTGFMAKELSEKDGFTMKDSSLSSELLQKELTNSLAEILNMDQGEIDVEDKFIDMGLDSITGVEWIQLINKRYGTSITATKIYDYPSIHQFARFLEMELNKYGRRLDQIPLKSSLSLSLDDILQQVQAGEIDIKLADQLFQQFIFGGEKH